jgi:hypothetical protein
LIHKTILFVARQLNIALWTLQVLLAAAYLAHSWMMVSPPPELLALMNAQLGEGFRLFIDQDLGQREARPAADIDDSGPARQRAGPLAHLPRTYGGRRRTAPTGKECSSDAFISIGWVGIGIDRTSSVDGRAERYVSSFTFEHHRCYGSTSYSQ